MDDNQFFALCWKIAGVILFTIVTTIGGCESYRASLVRDAIRAGADPLRASCAIYGMISGSTICAVLATK
jgi:hypothetical protein